MRRYSMLVGIAVAVSLALFAAHSDANAAPGGNKWGAILQSRSNASPNTGGMLSNVNQSVKNSAEPPHTLGKRKKNNGVAPNTGGMLSDVNKSVTNAAEAPHTLGKRKKNNGALLSKPGGMLSDVENAVKDAAEPPHTLGKRKKSNVPNVTPID